jgi:uncharacterized protein (TIGR02271 family)
MTVIDQSQAQQLIGQNLSTTDGTKIGKIGQLYLDDYHGQPEWVTVNTGLFGTNESFVPLAEATQVADGITVPYTKDQIKDAPNISDSGHLTEAEEQDLYKHYNVAYTTEGSTFAGTSGAAGASGHAQDSRAARSTETPRDATTGDDASDSGADEAMTRSEESLNVGTEQVQTGRARLRKWVETENVQVDVPVRKEKAVLVTEAITDANRGDAYAGPDLSDDEHEVVLSEERPVVSKETVAKERVRLGKQVVESTETVSDDVRKERIEAEGDVDDTDLPGGRH